MYVLAVVQARIGSTRLPGKVLADVNNRPLLWYVVRRAQLAKLVDQVVVAVPETPEDLEIAKICAEWGVPCVMGPEQDVLARYLEAAQLWQPRPDVIVRLTADCPLIDPQVIDAVLQLFWRRAAPRTADVDHAVAYASNVFPVRTFPDGLDVEAFPLATLERLDALATSPADREHVTSHLHANPQAYLAEGRGIRTCRLQQNLAEARWTVDTAEDLEFVQNVYGYFGCPWDASMGQIIDRCRRRVLLAGERTH